VLKKKLAHGIELARKERGFVIHFREQFDCVQHFSHLKNIPTGAPLGDADLQRFLLE
jgi:hypothetical protein